MYLVIAIVAVLVALTFIALYLRSVGDVLALNEYCQFLLLTPSTYEDHRAKFADYLASSTAQLTNDQRAMYARLSLEKMARDCRPKFTLANIARRKAAATKSE